MTTYKGINGFAVQSVASDPSPTDEGQVWYNNATYAFKLASVTTTGTWASGGNLNTARSQGAAAGISTAALMFGGSPDLSSGTGATESYNGSTWTNVNSLTNTNRYILGAGTQSSALRIGGYPQTDTVESWGGTSWTAGTNFPTAISQGAATGNSNTAIMAIGGEIPARTTNSFKYNGTSWTSGGSLAGVARSNNAACGITTAALTFGGGDGTGSIAATESYNGTSWTTVASLNTARANLGGAGTNTLAVAFGGAAALTATELWNGTSWTTNPNSMTTGLNNMGYTGTQAAALSIGGSPPTQGTTQLFTGPGAPVTKTITTS